ncbi:MAG: hypothetical protein ACRDRS_14415 [Pseudonocardiaceae bacterium]
MAQLERPVNLDRWSSPEGRLLTSILIRCGPRACDGCTLPFDCLVHDGQGAPYLRYHNQKMKREAAVPIDEELQAEIRAQQARVLERWPAGNPNLFPRRHTFAPELREQHHQTLTLITVSTDKGHTRVTEMNQQVLTNLDRMISEVEKAEQSDTVDAR